MQLVSTPSQSSAGKSKMMPLKKITEKLEVATERDAEVPSTNAHSPKV